MILIDELIADYKDLEKLQDGKNPFSTKSDEFLPMQDYVAIIKGKAKIAEALLACGVIGIEDVPPFRALQLTETPALNPGLEITE